MLKKENTKLLKLLSYGALAGITVLAASLLCCAMLIERGVLGQGSAKYLPWACTAMAAAASSARVCLRTRQKMLPLSLGANLPWMLCAGGISALLRGGEISFQGAALFFLIGLISILAVCLVASKSTKVRKIKKLHK